MSGPSMSATVKGAQNVSRAFQMLNAETRRLARHAVIESLDEAKGEAISRVPVDTGELKATIRTEMFADSTGVQPAGALEVGYGTLRRRSRSTGKRKSRRGAPSLANTQPGVYAMVVEFGDAKRNKPARPFIVPAIEATRPHHLARMAAALAGAVDAAEAAGAGGDAP